MVIFPQIFVVNRLAALDVGADNVKLLRVGIVGGKIKRVDFQRYRTVTEISVINVAGFQQGSKAAVALISAKTRIITDNAANLF